MFFKLYIVTAALATASCAEVLTKPLRFPGALWKPMRCTAPDMNDERKALAKQFALQEAEARESGSSAICTDIPVSVYLHTISASQNTLLSNETLHKQMQVLRTDFSGSGFKLTLANITRTVNTLWARDGNSMAMKTMLRQGSYRDLNLYFVDSMEALGYCFFPTNAPEGSEEFIRDGCIIVASSVPGGKAPYNLGKTAVHETGHWFGLEHTFQGGCNAPGDGVEDTPYQASASSGCPQGRDSCPNKPGLDPIHNYMDYSEDACYEEFTPGQKARMMSYWQNFRAGK